MKQIVPCLVAILLVGCVAYEPKPLKPSVTAAAYEARTLDAPELRQFLEKNLGHEITPWPPKSWDLSSLTLAAFYYHPDLDAARSAWEVAEAGKLKAGQHPNPNFSFTPQRHSDTAGGALSPWTLGFNLDVPVETAGKRGYRIARAEKLSNAARLNIAAVAWQVRSRLESSIFDLYAATESEPLRKRQEQARAEIVRLLEARLSVGEASLPEVTQARLALEQSRLLLAESQGALAQCRTRLAAALGLPKEAVDGLTVSFDSIGEAPALPAARDLRRYALTSRPDVLALLSEYDAAEAALAQEIAAQYPDVHLGPGYQWDQGDDVWSLGFSVTLPIFNRNSGGIAEAEARRKETAARFAALQARVAGELDHALAGYRALLGKLAVADAMLLAEKKRLNSVQSRFEAGEADRLALTSAALESESTGIDRLETLSRVLQARREVEDALQRPLFFPASFQPDVETSPRPGKENTR